MQEVLLAVHQMPAAREKPLRTASEWAELALRRGAYGPTPSVTSSDSSWPLQTRRSAQDTKQARSARIQAGEKDCVFVERRAFF